MVTLTVIPEKWPQGTVSGSGAVPMALSWALPGSCVPVTLSSEHSSVSFPLFSPFSAA